MSYKLALTHTLIGHIVLAAYVFLAVKVFVTLLQLKLAAGNFRDLPQTILFRILYLAGKVTPALALGCLCVAAGLQHNRALAWIFFLLTLSVSVAAFVVVRLRRKRKFFGVVDLVQKSHE